MGFCVSLQDVVQRRVRHTYGQATRRTVLGEGVFFFFVFVVVFLFPKQGARARGRNGNLSERGTWKLVKINRTGSGVCAPLGLFA